MSQSALRNYGTYPRCGLAEYWKQCILGQVDLRISYALGENTLAVNASLIQQATRRHKRLVRLENAELFVYLRHGRNAWKFEVGRFMNPKGWSPTTAPSGFSKEVLDLYRSAAESLSSVC